MVESLKELNAICQKPDYKTVGNWMVRKILRPAALPLTWLLLHTNVTADQVTLGALAVGLLGNLCLAFPGSGPFLAAVLLLQFWYLLDHVDGQIARYRKSSSLTGRFFDYIMHHVVHGTVFFALSWSVYSGSGNAAWIFWGFLTSFCMTLFNLIWDTEYKAFQDKIMAAKQIEIKTKSSADASGVPAGESGMKKVFSILHKSAEMHVLMNVLTLAALLQCFVLKDVPFRGILFCFYAVAVPVITITKISFFILTRRVDEDFNSTFTVRS